MRDFNRKELENGETGENVTLEKKPYETLMNLCFYDKNLSINMGGEELKLEYKLADDHLIFGDKIFIVERLENDTLIILEKNSEPFSVNFRRHLIKVNDESKKTKN